MKPEKESTVIRLRGRNQFTLPDNIASELKLKEGDFLQVSVVEGGCLRMMPVRLVPVVGTPEAEEVVRRAKEDLQAGRVEVFDSTEALAERILKKKGGASRAATVRRKEALLED